MADTPLTTATAAVKIIFFKKALFGTEPAEFIMCTISENGYKISPKIFYNTAELFKLC